VVVGRVLGQLFCQNLGEGVVEVRELWRDLPMDVVLVGHGWGM